MTTDEQEVQETPANSNLSLEEIKEEDQDADNSLIESMRPEYETRKRSREMK